MTNVLFDANYIHEQHYAAFFRLITRPDQLAGLPASEPHASRHKDWTFLIPAESIDGAIIEGTSGPPPRYTEAPAKRTASPSTPSPPHKHKRRFGSRTPSSTAYPLPSPTEKATSTAASPKPQHSSPASHYWPDIQHLVANAIESLLPQALQKARETETNLLKEQLPEALEKLSSAISRSNFVY